MNLRDLLTGADNLLVEQFNKLDYNDFKHFTKYYIPTEQDIETIATSCPSKAHEILVVYDASQLPIHILEYINKLIPEEYIPFKLLTPERIISNLKINFETKVITLYHSPLFNQEAAQFIIENYHTIKQYFRDYHKHYLNLRVLALTNQILDKKDIIYTDLYYDFLHYKIDLNNLDKKLKFELFNDENITFEKILYRALNRKIYSVYSDMKYKPLPYELSFDLIVDLYKKCPYSTFFWQNLFYTHTPLNTLKKFLEKYYYYKDHFFLNLDYYAANILSKESEEKIIDFFDLLNKLNIIPILYTQYKFYKYNLSPTILNYDHNSIFFHVPCAITTVKEFLQYFETARA